MRKIGLAVLVAVLGLSGVAHADAACPEGKTCVDAADMPVFLEALREKKCLETTPPTLVSDPIAIVTDRQGRIYGTGSDPHPFILHLGWCNYDLSATGQVSVVAAERVEPTWGFRFRPKATVGILGTELLVGEKFTNALDGGILLEPFFVHWVNANGYVGVRSVGAGVGFDITKNFGVYAGYAITWGQWRSNPFASASFAFW